MDTLRVNLGPRSYDITFTSGGGTIAAFARAVLPTAKLALVVADTNTAIPATYIRTALETVGIHAELATVPAGEESKSLERASQLYDALYALAADRKTAVVAVGGGVVGDLAGFAAATYNRGLPLLMVPTSLLAMVDSSVGGKVGINHPKGKNLIGAFHQPTGVWIDTDYLRTLPEREYLSGLAEVVKYGVILDAEFFAFLESNVRQLRDHDPPVLRRVIERCCRIKADVVTQDEREETGLRAVLNYGHTFAHAFETVGGYGAWLHGEAVAAGMVCASKLAAKLELISDELTRRQETLLSAFSLPIAPKAGWSTDDQLAVMRRDKKADAGQMRFILPRRLGEVALFDDVPEQLVRDVLEGR